MTHHDLFRQLEKATCIALLLGVVGLAPPATAQQADSLEWGARAGIGLAGVTIQEVSRGAYGLYGGPTLKYGRFRGRGEVYLMLADKPGAEAAREYGLCEDGSCQQLFAWASASAVVDLYQGESTRFYLGGGVDVGSHTGPYATTGLVFGSWGIGAKLGAEQVFVGAFLWR